MSRLWSAVIPHVRLSDEAYRLRHRVLRIILWLQVPMLTLVAGLNGGLSANAGLTAQMPGMGSKETAALWVFRVMGVVLVACVLGSAVIRSRRVGAAVVSLGLLLSASLLVWVGGGRTDLHFSFFLVVALISLYQDWLPLAISVVLVIVHHLVMGALAPTMLYSDPRAARQPVQFAILHAGFVVGICAIQVAYWRFSQSAQQQTDRVRAEAVQAIRRTGERFETLVQDSSDIIAVLDPDGRILSISSAVQRIMGQRPEDLIGTKYEALIHPDDRPGLRLAARLEPEERRAEVRTRHADGTWHWHDVTMRNLIDNPAVAGWVVNHRDVTERRSFQQRLVYEASHDALTGLANRAELLRVLEQGLADLLLDRSGLAVLYLDLDGFKQVNDSYGHEAGDALLIAVAGSIGRCILGSDTVGRLGGDEFAVVLTRIATADDAVAVAGRILAELAQPVMIGGRIICPRASIGIALAEPGSRTDELLHRADTAMYHAKRDATINWRLYQENMQDPSSSTAAVVLNH